VFGQVSTGASNDIEQATKLARAMITRYGMSDEFDMVAMETVTNQLPWRRHEPGLLERDAADDRPPGGRARAQTA
jgi:ATP-dependent Zn protease